MAVFCDSVCPLAPGNAWDEVCNLLTILVFLETTVDCQREVQARIALRGGMELWLLGQTTNQMCVVRCNFSLLKMGR